MDAIPFRAGKRSRRRGRVRGVCAGASGPLVPAACLTALALAAVSAGGAASLARAEAILDRPIVWYDDDRRDIPRPEPREPNLLWSQAQDAIQRPAGRWTHPGRLVRQVGRLFGGQRAQEASDVNALDEVPNSSWFENRIGLAPIAPEEAARRAGSGSGPDTSAPWVVIRAKTEGVTPGFTIRDARGVSYLLKFDPPGFPETATGAGAIAVRILHACGYNVPEDDVVIFRRERLVVGEGVKIRTRAGTVPMTERELDEILRRVERLPDGRWRAIASRYLEGQPLGPFDYKGRRKDDPNDRIPHEDRRELRGLSVIAAWLNHFDTKQQNSLDMYVEEGGRRYVKHHLIDFASTLGAGAIEPIPKYGYEHSLDFPAITYRLLSLGIHDDVWRRLELPPGLPEIGYYEADPFDPLEWKPLLPNPAFANLTDRDGYWAAKIVSAFSDDLLRAIVETARFRNPRASEYLLSRLVGRRDRIARTWFTRVPPLDFFAWEPGRLSFHDLGVERRLFDPAATRYRARAACATGDRAPASWTSWRESAWPAFTGLDESAEGVRGARRQGLAEERAPFLAVECQVNRGSGWSPSTLVYISRARGRVVAVER